MTDPVERVTRRTILRRGGSVVLGSAVIWASPSVRTVALDPNAAGTPPPTGSVAAHSHTPTDAGGVDATGKSSSSGEASSSTDPGGVDANGESSGQLPFTGIDPKPLLMAGGTALAAGSALMAIAQDPDPSRGER